jgi:RNA polymerase sigma-70 factor (ECF subfamily)
VPYGERHFRLEEAASMDTMSERKAEFAARLRQHQNQLFGFIYSLVRDFDDADDLFQQTSLVLWDKFDLFDPSKSFIAWACGVARFEVSNFLRSRSRQRLHFTDELSLMLIDVHEELEQEQLEGRRHALAECMKKLRSRDQQLLDACYQRSARIPEVARGWGRSSQSIHNSLRRIRRTLFECVSRSLAQEGVI